MKVKVTVDRLEGEYAVLLIRPKEEEKIDWPVEFLPDDVEEGDILNININKSNKEKRESQERVKNLIEKLKNKRQ